MEYRNFGNTGLKVSVISLGTMILGKDHAKEREVLSQVIHKAWEAGINFFDSAEVYTGGKSEQFLGEIIRELPAKREELVISTKLFWGRGAGINDTGLSRKKIMESMNCSLKNMQLD